MAERQPVRVTISGQTFTLLAADDPREVEELARGVDDLLNVIADRMPAADSSRVAIFACLELAGRLRDVKRDLTALKDRIDRKSEELTGLLERAVSEP
jgi:cell division protein ZapA